MQKGKKKIIVYNLLFLGTLFAFFLLKSVKSGQYENWIYWPGSYVTALALLSSFVLTLTPLKFRKVISNNGIIFCLQGLFFGIALWLMSDFLTLIFERFFGYEEHYRFTDLLHKWSTDWYLGVEGIFIFFWYQLILRMRLQNSNKLFLEKKLNDMEGDVKEAKLESLQSELNPHFLYNAMNSISMMIRVKEYAKSIDMIANLNELLRVVLYKTGEKLISVQDELTLLDKYLQVEMVRFGDRVEVVQEIPAEVYHATVPQLILQPLVENAFKHGMTDDLGRQQILISASSRENKLLLSVFNTTQSKLQLNNSRQKEKIGLQNITNRLRRIYGSDFRFQLVQQLDGIEFKIEIPLKQ